MPVSPEVTYVTAGIVGGVSASAANNVIAYFNHFHAEKLTKTVNFILFVLCQIFNALSIVGFLVGASSGPTAIVMPLVTASKLFSNMLFQHGVGIYTFSKPTRVGTYIVLVSVILLVQVGPSEDNQSVDTNEEALAMLSEPAAWRWLLASTAVLLLSLIGTCFYKTGSIHLILMCVVVALSTALGACAGKFLFVFDGIDQAIVGLIYLSTGVISFVWSFFASYTCSMAIFYPLEEFLQLAVNAITGIFVWKELRTVEQPISYFCVLLMIAIAVYLCTSFDVVGTVAQYYTKDQKKYVLQKGRDRFPMLEILNEISLEENAGDQSRRKSAPMAYTSKAVFEQLNNVWKTADNSREVGEQFRTTMEGSDITLQESILITSDLAEALAAAVKVMHRHVDEDEIRRIFDKRKLGHGHSGKDLEKPLLEGIPVAKPIQK